ncbi:DUF2071 domain-containing protein [Microbacterium sp. LMI1-1-1.1]|uniref:DUF2071 domain-containing protein n=1 Tax=Microbacterium sp. LMI1-1-1.1 TaxID=3135223 RepID=UPI0034667219
MATIIPTMAATIERRLLVNYRVDPAVARELLPQGLRPQLIDGSAVAGVCLIRLGAFRPAWVGPEIGHRSENAAHRIAVEWDAPSGTRTGVYIPRRHSASRLARLVGGRVFPGVHRRARIVSKETDAEISVHIDADDLRVRVDARLAPDEAFRSGLFPSLASASDFFRKDAVGWSPARNGSLEGLRLDTDAWRVEAATIDTLESSSFDGLPAGSAEFDDVLVMRRVPARWSSPSDPAPASRTERATSGRDR